MPGTTQNPTPKYLTQKQTEVMGLQEKLQQKIDNIAEEDKKKAKQQLKDLETLVETGLEALKNPDLVKKGFNNLFNLLFTTNIQDFAKKHERNYSELIEATKDISIHDPSVPSAPSAPSASSTIKSSPTVMFKNNLSTSIEELPKAKNFNIQNLKTILDQDLHNQKFSKAALKKFKIKDLMKLKENKQLFKLIQTADLAKDPKIDQLLSALSKNKRLLDGIISSHRNNDPDFYYSASWIISKCSLKNSAMRLDASTINKITSHYSPPNEQFKIDDPHYKEFYKNLIKKIKQKKVDNIENLNTESIKQLISNCESVDDINTIIGSNIQFTQENKKSIASTVADKINKISEENKQLKQDGTSLINPINLFNYIKNRIQIKSFIKKIKPIVKDLPPESINELILSCESVDDINTIIGSNIQFTQKHEKVIDSIVNKVKEISEENKQLKQDGTSLINPINLFNYIKNRIQIKSFIKKIKPIVKDLQLSKKSFKELANIATTNGEDPSDFFNTKILTATTKTNNTENQSNSQTNNREDNPSLNMVNIVPTSTTERMNTVTNCFTQTDTAVEEQYKPPPSSKEQVQVIMEASNQQNAETENTIISTTAKDLFEKIKSLKINNEEFHMEGNIIKDNNEKVLIQFQDKKIIFPNEPSKGLAAYLMHLCDKKNEKPIKKINVANFKTEDVMSALQIIKKQIDEMQDDDKREYNNFFKDFSVTNICNGREETRKIKDTISQKPSV